jgi:urease beta subunit
VHVEGVRMRTPARLGVWFTATVLATTVVLATLLALPALASPAWRETATVKGKPLMSFTVDKVSIGSQRWSAHVSFRNLSKRTVRVGNDFGLIVYRKATIEPNTRPEAFGRATSFSTPRPLRLEPGASWSGTIAGPGRPKVTGMGYARILFGPFTGLPRGPDPFLWITDHSIPLDFSPSGSTGLVI